MIPHTFLGDHSEIKILKTYLLLMVLWNCIVILLGVTNKINWP